MRKHLPVLLIFVVLIIILTFPLLLKFTSCIPGFSSTDEPYGNIWEIWRIHYSLHHSLSLGHTQLMCYPFGFTPYSDGYIPWLWVALTHMFSWFFTPLLIYNAQILLNMLLSGIFSYILIYYVTGKNIYCGLLGGIAFAYCPYQFSRFWQHIGLTYSQWIPLCLLTAIYFKESFSRKSAFLFLLSLFLLFSFDFSVMYFSAISIGVFIFYCTYNVIKKKLASRRLLKIDDFKYVLAIVGMGLLAFLILFWQFFPIFKNMIVTPSVVASAQNAFRRPFEDLFIQSARPLSYFLPSTSHPIFGKFTEQFIGTSIYGTSLTEHTLYLGWVPLILAIYAVRRWRKDHKTKGQPPAEAVPVGSPFDFYIGFFVTLAVVAWLFSQPPWWQLGPLKIYMPSFFMYKILPMFRAYCRFGIVVMLAVAVLAGFGLRYFLERFKSNRVKISITVLFSVLVLFEFWNWPPYKVIDVSKFPAVYYWLKEQPKETVIAEYPLDTEGPNEMYKFYQTKHEKKIINGTIPGTEANRFAKNIINLSNPRTAGILKWMGVKYVLVHINDYKETEQTELIEELSKIPRNKGLNLIGNFYPQDCPDKNIMCIQKTGPVDVYEVVATAINPQN